jgi:C-terminal processing protease CtpA/Prc
MQRKERLMQKLVFLPLLALALVLGTLGTAAAAPARQDGTLPPAPIENDEGGPARLVGGLDYTDFALPVVLQDPAPALLDMVHVVQRDGTQFAPIDSQIIGYMTTPVAPPPLGYAFNLPIAPQGTLLDVDNNGQEDTGVQIFSIMMGANINGGSHLEQLDQAGDVSSYLTDPATGEITEGGLLIYAPDDKQGFPSGFGEDGLLFTEDDPAVSVPQGYTVVHFGPEGFTFDRAAEATLDLLEDPESSSPDFSQQGIVESYNSLIDHLALRYSFTDLRKLDWEALRAEFLPQVEEAEQASASNPNAGGAIYAFVLHQLAQKVRDAHVMAVIGNPAFAGEAGPLLALKNQPIATNVGANTAELDDGRIIVTDVITGSPAAEARWTLGTEIVAIDGKPVADIIPGVYYTETVGTDESQRLFQVGNLLKFSAPEAGSAPADVTVDAILPGETDAQSFTLTPGIYTLPARLARAQPVMPIDYYLGPNYGYITWEDFTHPEVAVATFRQFLKDVQAHPNVKGLVIDMRGNSGGWDLLYLTMGSYFFNADNPVSMNWNDQDSFDANKGELVREAAHKYLLSAPQPELYYDGPVVVLVDQNCASSCEFFTQFLQTNGRVTVVGEHASAGAGAPINRVSMPDGILFQYTKGRSYFAGTDEMNLEAKGVVPDVRLPVTEESEAARVAGGDPVLAGGLKALNELSGKAAAATIKLVPLTADATGGNPVEFSGVYPEGWSYITKPTGHAFQSADGSMALVYDTTTPDGVAGVVAPLGITDLEAQLVETHTVGDVEWKIVGNESNGFAYHAAIADIGGKTYIITIASPAAIVEQITEALLYPALDAFAPNAGS